MLQKVKQDVKDWEFWDGITILNRVVSTGLTGRWLLRRPEEGPAGHRDI